MSSLLSGGRDVPWRLRSLRSLSDFILYPIGVYSLPCVLHLVLVLAETNHKLGAYLELFHKFPL